MPGALSVSKQQISPRRQHARCVYVDTTCICVCVCRHQPLRSVGTAHVAVPAEHHQGRQHILPASKKSKKHKSFSMLFFSSNPRTCPTIPPPENNSSTYKAYRATPPSSADKHSHGLLHDIASSPTNPQTDRHCRRSRDTVLACTVLACTRERSKRQTAHKPCSNLCQQGLRLLTSYTMSLTVVVNK